MGTELMNLKILLPFRIFAEIKYVKRIVIETSKGSYGFLPQRLDCVAAVVPGILTIETEEKGVEYIAVDEGIFIKTGWKVMISVRNAIGGADLGMLQELTEKQFVNLDEREKTVRSVVKKMESGFIQSLEKLHKE